MPSSLIQIIKQIAAETIEAKKPCNYVVGIVVSVNPTAIKISQSLTLTSDFLVITQTVSDLQNGDKVLMIRRQGGQEYAVIDKVV